MSASNQQQQQQQDKTNQPCRAWGTLRGCRRGDDCTYKHEGAQGDAARTRVKAKGGEICQGWSSERGCRYGDACPYEHSGPGSLYVEKTAQEKAKEVCRAYKSDKGCRNGDKCAYLHAGESGKVAAAEKRKEEAEKKKNETAAKKATTTTTKTVAKVDEACNNWSSEKGCWKGDDCKYKHIGKTGNPNPVKPERRVRGRGRRSAAASGEKKPATTTVSTRGSNNNNNNTKKTTTTTAVKKVDEACNNWKSEKGCWRGDECPYKHVGKTGNPNPVKPERRVRGRRSAAASGDKKPATTTTTTTRGNNNNNNNNKASNNNNNNNNTVTKKTTTTAPGSKVDEVCNNWSSEKGCWKGDTCQYKHVGKTGNPNPVKPERRRRSGEDKPASAATSKAATGAVTTCKFFNSAQGCTAGKNCKYSHE